MLKKGDIFYWTTLVGIISTIYFFFSSRQFSLLFTLTGTIQTFGFIIVAMKINKSRSVVGLSKQTFLSYTVIFGLRSILFLFYRGYLPFDSSGVYIFKIQQILATVLSCYIFYCITMVYKSSYNPELDTIKSWYLMALAFILAVFFHSNLNRSLFGDLVWAFSQYLQTFAILSQFVLFKNKGKQIESYTSNFVATQAISRVLSIIFWIDAYKELNYANPENTYAIGYQYVGHWFMLSQFIHLLIMADFIYYWVRSLVRGEGLTLA